MMASRMTGADPSRAAGSPSTATVETALAQQLHDLRVADAMLFGNLGGKALAVWCARKDPKGTRHVVLTIDSLRVRFADQAAHKGLTRRRGIDVCGGGAQFVQVGNIDRPGAQHAQPTQDTRGQVDRLEGAGARECFVEQHQAARGGMLKDGGQRFRLLVQPTHPKPRLLM
jgi:hypothetical protein